MAHPWLYDSVELIPELAGLGLDGIEVWHDSANEEQTDKLIEIAKKYDLCMTGGNDFPRNDVPLSQSHRFQGSGRHFC